MKKITLYLFTLLVAVFAFHSCEDPYAGQESALPTIFEQGAVQSADGFVFALNQEVTTPITYTEEDLANEKVYQIIQTNSTPNLPEGTSVTFELEASDTKDFVKVVSLPSESADNGATVKVTDLDAAVKSLYGRAPYERDVYVRATYYLVKENSSVQGVTPIVLGPIKITPIAPVIETEYYLIGNLNGWDITNLDAYKFNHSGKDVYEDPIFTILVPSMLDGDGNGYFKIVPKSSKEAASWDGVLGNPIDGNTELEGEIIVENAQAMRVTEPGWVKITLDMLSYTYTIEIIGEMPLKLYVPGGHQGWNPGAAPFVYNRNFDMKFDGYVYFSAGNEFKFTSQPNWDGINYGNGGEGILSDDGGAGNLSVAEDGYYRLSVDLSGSPYTYSAVKTEWGLIGDATAGGWDNSTAMTYNADTKLWTVVTNLEAGKSFKFRANNAWEINLDGAADNLSYNGDNIEVTTGGKYLISLDLSNPEAYKFTMTAVE